MQNGNRFIRVLAAVLVAACWAWALDGVSYIDASGAMRTANGVTVISSNGGDRTLSTGWYLMRGTFTNDGTITVSGAVHIILENGSDVTVKGSTNNAGINVSEVNSLSIYAQSTDDDTMGKLIAVGNDGGAGIGGGGNGNSGNGYNSGTININGGTVTAIGCIGAAIGGGGGIRMNGGNGGNGGTIKINSGTVMATTASVYGCPSLGAGIGGGGSFSGNGGNGGTINISGGTVMVNSGRGAGIGGGSFNLGGVSSNGGTINITSGTVTATSSEGAGIGGSYRGNGGTININGGTVTATSSYGGAGIGCGGGYYVNGGTINITGGVVLALANSEYGGAGIGGGSYSDNSGTFKLDNNAVVFASSIGATGTDLNLTSGTLFFVNSNTSVITGTPISAHFSTTGVTAMWTKQGGKNGIAYASGNKTSFIDALDVVRVTDFMDGVSYIDEDGIIKIANKVAVIDANNIEVINTENIAAINNLGGWFLVRGNLERNTTFTVTGAAHIILEDGSNLTVKGSSNNAGINVSEGNKLSIYAQSIDASTMGKLTVTGGSDGAGIGGGKNSNGGTINIIGGMVNGSSISGTVTITGGMITVTNYISGTVTITGGMITATNYISGGTLDGDAVVFTGGSVGFAGSLSGILFISKISGTILAGTPIAAHFPTTGVTAIWAKQGGKSGIAYSSESNTGFIEIPNVTVVGNSIDNVKYIDENGITKTVNNVAVINAENIAAIDNLGGWILIRGNLVRNTAFTVTGTAHIILEDGSNVTVKGADDGGIKASVGNSLSIYAQSTNDETMGKLTASGQRGVGIGGGGTININGGVVTATGGNGGAGIGAYRCGDGTTINISGGIITATGSYGFGCYTSGYSAGIGGCYGGNGGTITITGGTVVANSGNNSTRDGGVGIGGSGGTIIITGGTVVAKSGYNSTSNGGVGIGGTFTLNGNAVVFASSVEDMEVERKTSGILCSPSCKFYGENVAISNVTIPANYGLGIPNGATLTIPTGITLTINGGVSPQDGSTVIIQGTVAGKKIRGANVSIPTLVSKTATSITINANLLATTGQMVEYAKNTTSAEPTSGWQTETTFDGLNANTTYYIFARSQENTNFTTGTSTSVQIKTKRIPLVTDLNFAIPTGHIYNGETRGIGNVTAKTKDIGAITVLYDDSSIAPTKVGTYSVTADIAESSEFIAVSGIELGEYKIAAKSVTITGISAANKEYDGNFIATVTGTPIVSGKVGNDDVTVTIGNASFNYKSVGTGRTVTFSGFSLDGADASNYTLSAQPANATSKTITAKPVTISISVSDKEYNGNTTATVAGTAIVNGKVDGDVVTVTNGSALFDNKNAGTDKIVTFSGFSIGGTNASNYTLSAQPAKVTANITVKPITGITAVEKEYNGTTTAYVHWYEPTSGKINNDDVTVTIGTALFDNKNVGTKKNVTFSASLSGTDANNYMLSQSSVTANIIAKPVTITGITASDKEYNGNTTATVTGTASINGKIDGDEVTVTSGSAKFNNKNAGIDKIVTFSGFSLSGTDAGNYTLAAQPVSVAANITVKPVIVTASAKSKVYGSADPTLTYSTIPSLFSGDYFSGTLSRTAGDKVGTYAINQGTLTADDNYKITSFESAYFTISAKPVTITGLSVSNKEYDGIAAATVTGTAVINGKVGTDDVKAVLGTASFNTKNVGNYKAVTFTDFALDGADVSNYTLSAQPTSVTANITTKPVTIAGITAFDKEYNGNTTATVTVTETAEVIGKVDGDAITVTNGTASFDNKNVGTGKTVTFTNFKLSDTDASNYTLSAQPKSVTANITAKPLTITGLSASSKKYDGNTNATFTGTTVINGKVSGDAVNVVNGNASFDNKNVENGKTVTFSGFSLSGTDAGNYTFTQPANVTANITVKSVTITGLSAANKEYDGNTSAKITGTATISEKVNGDIVTVIDGDASFNNKNVGNNRIVTFSGFSLSGADANNYTLSAQPVNVTANITAKPITITVKSITATSREYDGTTDAEVHGNVSISGEVSGDNVTIVKGNASFNDKNVGTNKPVAFSGFSLSGADVNNYTVSVYEPISITANITAKPVTITGISAIDKEYDGNTAATVTGSATINGKIRNDDVKVTLGLASFNNKNVENSKTVTFSSFSLSGTDADNYTFTQPANVTANIIAKPLTITNISASNKEYNGNKTATVTGTPTISGKIGNDAVTVTNGSAEFNNKNVENGKTVTFSGFSLDGTDAVNYRLSAQPASVTANITAKPLTITGISASDKEYDGTMFAKIVTENAVISGKVGSDAVTIANGSATFDDKNVGTNKPVAFSGFSLIGTDANNYTLTAQPESVTANITPKPITITGISASNKEYDGTTTATITRYAPPVFGIIGSDAVTIANGSATFDSKNVGNSKTVTFSGFSLSGTDASNYTLTQPASVTANITKKSITITSVTANNREYNGTTTVNLTGGELIGAFSEDDIDFTLGTGIVSNAYVGSNKAVSTNITLTGADALNYTLTQPKGITVEIKKPNETPTFPNRENPKIGRIEVQTTGNAILLSNLPQNAKVEVYNLQGKLIYSAHPENDHPADVRQRASSERAPKILRIGVQTGIYIIKIGTQTIRAAVR